jgi:hypothetical protein
MRLRWGSHSAWSATGSRRSQKIPETYEYRLRSPTTRTTQTDAGKLWLRAAICQRRCGAGLLPRLTSRSADISMNGSAWRWTGASTIGRKLVIQDDMDYKGQHWFRKERKKRHYESLVLVSSAEGQVEKRAQTSYHRRR